MGDFLKGSLLVLTVLTVACEAKPPTPKPVRIGLSMDSFVVERWIRDRDIFVSEAQALGAEVLVQVANEDHDTQVQQINLLLGQDIDVLVVVPNDSQRLGAAIRQLEARGLPVLSYDRLILNGKVDLYVSHDSVGAGRLMANAVEKSLATRPSPYRLVVVNGARSDHNSALMNQGYHEVLDSLVRAQRVSIVSEVWLSAWSSEEAEASFRKALAGMAVQPDGVIAANDLLAESLVRVLAQKSFLDGTLVTGMDADLAACQRVVEGTQTMTVYKPIAPLATTAAKYAVLLALHQPLGVTETINDGSFDVPFVKLQPVAVYQDNMKETVVRDGFHRADEIYRNMDPRAKP